MISYEKFTLSNGLRVIVHEDSSTPMACLNILYNVGARDEEEERTGFAHLFEHLMFGGSINIPNYDSPLQVVGGENNAFTNNDITNYYLTLPSENIETGFWLESDRMLSLAFSEKSLEVQRNVVVEEFKQRYLNQPYGDEWLLLRPLAYKKHPYRWATIGKEISHIENAKMEDVKAFFKKFYNPSNAIMVVAGDVKTDQVKALAEKWFGDIESGQPNNRSLPKEPAQTEERKLEVFKDVPSDSITKVWHMAERMSAEYHAQDLLSDVLGRGSSSRLHRKLVKEKQFFSSISAYVTGSFDSGLLVIHGRLVNGVKMEQADEAIIEVIEELKTQKLDSNELKKVKHKAESTHVFGEVSVLNKAMNLAFGELLGDTEMINTEISKINAISEDDILLQANRILVNTNCSTLYYRREKL
ncbi:MAG: pitrilysin family protein [Bacteroidia bacterium]